MEKDSKIDIEKINRFLREEHSEEDRLYLNEVFCDENKVKELEKNLRKQWYDQLSDNDFKEKQLDHILYKIHYNINSEKYKPKHTISKCINWLSRIAVVLILPLLLYCGINLYRSTIRKELPWIEINAPAWTRAQFTLPDGTKGWLNSNSSIRYKGNYLNNRNVILNGEAFFDVFTDEKRPFVVDANEVIITAVGTRFNVASYDEENEVEVVLEEGKILVNDKKEDKLIQIAPNERFIYNKNLNTYITDTVQIKKYTSWTEGKLIFRNDPIDVIARRLGRWYNVDVELVNNNYQDILLRATFENENLEEVLFYLKNSLNIDYKIINENILENNEVYVKKKVIISTERT